MKMTKTEKERAWQRGKRLLTTIQKRASRSMESRHGYSGPGSEDLDQLDPWKPLKVQPWEEGEVFFFGGNWNSAELLPVAERRRVRKAVFRYVGTLLARRQLESKVCWHEFGLFVWPQFERYLRRHRLRDEHPYLMATIADAFLLEIIERYPQVTWKATRARLRMRTSASEGGSPKTDGTRGGSR